MKDHAPVPACADCGEVLVADYDGEIWHQVDLEEHEAELGRLYPSRREELPAVEDTRTLREKVLALVKNLTDG